VGGCCPRRGGCISFEFFDRSAKAHDENYEGWVDTVAYGCGVRRRWYSSGCSDEALVRNQDDELNLRLTRAGGKIWQSRAIVSWYSPRAALSSSFANIFQYGSGKWR